METGEQIGTKDHKGERWREKSFGFLTLQGRHKQEDPSSTQEGYCVVGRDWFREVNSMVEHKPENESHQRIQQKIV